MKIAVVKETKPNENRIAILPQIVEKFKKIGFDVEIENDLGKSLNISNEEFTKAGALINNDRKALLSSADIILRLNPPPVDEISLLKQNALHISFFDPFNEKDITNAFLKQNVTSLSMQMIPRSTIAQKMDALSSQANLAGYAAVILAADHFNKIFPMMTTPAGTIYPAKVFIIGVGVAGLQAIATARRLGARVEAFDTRAVVEEQVKSLGAKFIKIDVGETGQTKQGYAKELTPEQLQKQKEGMKKVCSNSDIVITTAQLFGKKAPILITLEMIKEMNPSSVIIDMAVSTGGNVEGSKPDEIVEINGVKIIGLTNIPGKVAYDASFMYSSNLYNLLEHFYNKESKQFSLNFDDEILKYSIITHNNKIQNELFK